VTAGFPFGFFATKHTTYLGQEGGFAQALPSRRIQVVVQRSGFQEPDNPLVNFG
jgi:hypothetical protein